MKRLQAVALLFVALFAVGTVNHETAPGTRTVVETRWRGNVQTVYVQNLSQYVSNRQVRAALPAFQAATSQDFAPVWKTDAHLVFTGRHKPPRFSTQIVLLDNSDVSNALAYHMTLDGHPHSRIFVGTNRYYHFSWQVAFTHELWEMLADPNIVTAAQGMDDPTFWAVEVSDPCEDDSQAYTRRGADGKPVRISDFITPNWFGAQVDGPYDFMHHISKPYDVLLGGYASYWDPEAGSWAQVSNFKGTIFADGAHFADPRD